MKWGRVDFVSALNAKKKSHTVGAYLARMSAAQNVGQRCFVEVPITTIYLKRKRPRNEIRKTSDIGP